MFDQSFRSYKKFLWLVLLTLVLFFSLGTNAQFASAAALSVTGAENGTIPDATGIAIRLDGTVGARPMAEDGIGEWSVDIGPSWNRRIHVVERTKLPDRLPTVGASIEVRGYLLVDRSIIATEIKVRSGSSDDHLPSLIFEGAVTAAPIDGGKIGLWTILVDDVGNGDSAPSVISLDVQSTSETRFGGGFPKIGQTVKIWATLWATGDIVGNDMRLQDDNGGNGGNGGDGDEDKIEFDGIVLSFTQRSDKGGQWVIESSERIYLVDANGETDLKDGVPVRGQRVIVKGTQKRDGRVIAQEIAIDGERNTTRVGIVLFKPTNEETIGLWRLRDAQGRNFAAQVDEQTVFDAGIPEIGDFVVVAGIPRGDATVSAKKIHLSALNDELEFGALVLQSPDTGDGSGEWRVGINRDLALVVVADGETEFRPRPPKASEWVKIKGRLLASGRIQAEEMRVERFADGELVVRLETDVVSGTIASRYNLIPHDTLLSSGNIFLFITPNNDEDIEEVIAQMSHDLDVVWTEPNFSSGIPVGNPYKTWKWGGTEESGYVNQIAFEQVNLAPAQAKYQGAGTVVAVLDTGVDFNHPSLAGHLLSGYDMVDDDADPQDEGDGLAWGHGTHITGIIAQMAPQTQVLPVRVLDTNGRGNTYLLAYAVEWAAANGADVINLSLGAEADSQLLRETIATVIAQGVTVVAAAGNSNESTAQYPAQYDGVISVSAIDEKNVKASFSNYGKEWVDIAAPGEGITSTIVGPDGSGYASWSGTSMSTSFVSGAAALTHEKLSNGSATGIATALISNAADLSGADSMYGAEIGGLLDLGAALIPDEGSEVEMRVFIPFIMRE